MNQFASLDVIGNSPWGFSGPILQFFLLENCNKYICNDLKWNCHINCIIKKAKKRLYSLSQLKRSGLGSRELVQFFCTCISPITEYACPVFHGILVYLSNDLEGLQKPPRRIIFSLCSYNETFIGSGLSKLSDRL